MKGNVMKNYIITAGLLVILALGAVGLSAQESPWSKFRHDSKNTGRTNYTGPATPTEAWSYQANDGIVSSAVIGFDGTIYVGAGWHFNGTLDSCLYAFNPDGSVKWCFKGEDGFFSTPAIGPDGTLFITGLDGYLYAVEDSITYGKMRWRTYLEYWFSLSSPAISNDGSTVYAGSPSFRFFSVDAMDGTINWNYKTGWCIISSPAIDDDGTIYCGTKYHKLWAYDEALQGPKWSAPTGIFFDGHLVDCSPAIGDNGTIYVGSDPYGAAGMGHVAAPVDTNFWAINPDGTIKWSFETDDGVESSPAIGHDGTIYFGSYDSTFYAVTDNGTYGTLKWKYKTGGPIDGSPTVDGDGTVYIGSRDSTLYAFNPDGSVKWIYPLADATESSPTIDGNGFLYIGDFSGKFHVLGTGAPDVGVKSINLPSNVQPDVSYSPSASVANFRAGGQTFDVSCVIDTNGSVIYYDIKTVSNHTGSGDVLFDTWMVGPDTGTIYNITIATLLGADDNEDNNEIVSQVTAGDEQFVCGDANADGAANVGDAVYMISYVFKGGPAPQPIEAGDANCDGQPNVGDAVYLINYVFKNGPEPCANCP
jgi:outer membrane protein assembly factor BamB